MQAVRRENVTTKISSRSSYPDRFQPQEKKRHTLRSSAVRFTVLTGAWGTELSRSLGGGSGSTGRLQDKSFKDAIVA